MVGGYGGILGVCREIYDAEGRNRIRIVIDSDRKGQDAVRVFLATYEGTYDVSRVRARGWICWFFLTLSCLGVVTLLVGLIGNGLTHDLITPASATILLGYVAYSARLGLARIRQIEISKDGISIVPLRVTFVAEEIANIEIKPMAGADVLTLTMHGSWYYPHFGGVWSWGNTVRIAFGRDWLNLDG